MKLAIHEEDITVTNIYALKILDASNIIKQE
jgi:hypothetical protein